MSCSRWRDSDGLESQQPVQVRLRGVKTPESTQQAADLNLDAPPDKRTVGGLLLRRTISQYATAVKSYRAVIQDWRPTVKDSGLNSRQHHYQRAAHVQATRILVHDALRKALWPRDLPGAPTDWRVSFVVGVRRGRIPDGDNQVGMLKSCRDSVADYLGWPDDPEHGPTWWYKPWARSTRDAVEIVVERADGICPMCGKGGALDA